MKKELLSSGLPEKTGVVIQDYLDTLNAGQEPSNVYHAVIGVVEKPMLEAMMRYTDGNQSKAAQCMGINRATLRSKLKRHDLL